MRGLGITWLTVNSAAEESFALPAGTIRIDLSNPSRTPIRYAFITGKVQAAALTLPNQYETLNYEYLILNLKFPSGGTFYFCGNSHGAVLGINVYVE